MVVVVQQVPNGTYLCVSSVYAGVPSLESAERERMIRKGYTSLKVLSIRVSRGYVEI